MPPPSPKNNTDETKNEREPILYVLLGEIQKEAPPKELEQFFDIFMGYLRAIQESKKFCWAGVLQPGQVMLLYEASDDEEASEIANSNPFLSRADLVVFDVPKKWMLLFGLGIS